MIWSIKAHTKLCTFQYATNVTNHEGAWWDSVGMHLLWTAHTSAFHWWQHYRDEILSPVVVPYVKLRHLNFQKDNTDLHIARICRDLLRQEAFAALIGHCIHQTCHLLNTSGMFWMAVSASRFQFPSTIANFKWLCWWNGTSSTGCDWQPAVVNPLWLYCYGFG